MYSAEYEEGREAYRTRRWGRPDCPYTDEARAEAWNAGFDAECSDDSLALSIDGYI